MFSVSLKNFHYELDNYTFNLATGIAAADIGKAVMIDASAANTVKLATAGAEILGRLEQVEDRTVSGLLLGTVALRFGGILPIKAGETVIVGDSLVGAGAGEVKAQAAEGFSAKFRVFEVVALEATTLTI
jgi:hypothetical protein